MIDLLLGKKKKFALFAGLPTPKLAGTEGLQVFGGVKINDLNSSPIPLTPFPEREGGEISPLPASGRGAGKRFFTQV
jgi:hypothetical protein